MQKILSQLDPSSGVPKVIEGVDPFDEQSAQARYLIEPPTKNPKKDELVRELYLALMMLVPAMSPEEARDEFIYKFGVSLGDMSFIELFEAKAWVSRLEVKHMD